MSDAIDSHISQVSKLQFDSELPNYKNSLINLQELSMLMVLPNQFFYIIDMEKITNIYIHPNILYVLGYSPQEFHDFRQIYSIIHPEDEGFVLDYTFKTIEYTRRPNIFCRDKTKWVFSITFRLLHKTGHYIWIERHANCYRCDRLNNMVFAICFYSDVSHLKNNNLIVYNYHVDDETPFDVSD